MPVMGKERADLAAASALSLPGILTWLGFACRQRVLETDFSRQSVPIEKCTWKEQLLYNVEAKQRN